MIDEATQLARIDKDIAQLTKAIDALEVARHAALLVHGFTYDDITHKVVSGASYTISQQQLKLTRERDRLASNAEHMMAQQIADLDQY